MSGAAEVERVCSAMEEAAGLLDLSCAHDKMVPVLNAFQDVLADGLIVFSMAGGRHATELDVTIGVSPEHGDPYTVALSHGFTEKTDHPVGAYLSDIQERLPVSVFAVDADVTGGFKKTYAWFRPDELPGVAELRTIPSMPRSVAENADLFARYGLDKVQMTSVDYKRKQINLYFSNLSPEFLESEAVLAMLREMGLRDTGELGLNFTKRAFSVYPTLSWDSAKISRICFAVISTDPTLLPTRNESDVALFSKYANNAPYAYVGEKRALVYGLTLSPDEEYYKLGAYYQISDIQRKLLKAFDVLDGQT